MRKYLTVTPFRHSRNAGGNPPPPSFPKFFIGNPRFCFFFVFKYCGPRLEDCRGDEEVGIHVFTEEEGKIHRGFPLPLFRPLVEPLRNDGQGDGGGVQK